MSWTESLKMAFAAIGSHKLRSFLTLVGIIAGVSAIISVMTGVAVVQETMEKEMSVLGSTTFQVQKWPPRGFGNRDDRDWRAIQRRKPLTVEHADAIRERVAAAKLVGAELWRYNCTVKHRAESTNPNVMACGGTPEYPANNTHYVHLGRNLTHEDVRVGRDVAVIGHAIAEQLFPFTDPIGKTVKLDGHKLVVQGVFEEKRSAVGGNFDNYVLIPISLWKRMYGARDGDGRERSVNITVCARSPELLADVLDETRRVLRAVRGVDPRDDDDFDIFTNATQIRAFNKATAGLKVGAFVLGVVALVVAGIGIMNIMLVSVTERTREIGIRKALGARRRAVLLQFLLEAVVLCNLGGVLGVLVGFGLGNLVAVFTEFAVHVPVDWAVRGVLFCSAVGLVFGMWPAVRASRLAPVDALRFE